MAGTTDADRAGASDRAEGTGEPAPVMVAAPVTAVTVFRDGARIVRSGQAELGHGLRPVRIEGLPASTDPASVRVAVRGEGVALLEVRARHQYGADPGRADVLRLRAEAERCRDAVRELDDEDAAEQARLTFAGHLSESAAAALARAVGAGRAGPEDLAGMAGHLAASVAAALTARREIARRKRAAERELDAAGQALADAEDRTGTAEFTEVTAVIEAARAAVAAIEVSYHVTGASWRPLYDIGLDGEQLTVTYLAEVTQRTGEDWPAVDLALATSRRGRHDELPELRPWYVGRPRAIPALPARAAAGGGGPLPEGTALRMAMAAPPSPPLTAEASESGAGQVYRVPRPVAVPADGDPHKVAIARLDLAAELDYLAVPVLAAEAYLRATVTNSSPLLLLPGPARIFRDNQFAGPTTLDTIAPGAEFGLQLGVDDRISIERTLVRRAASKAVLGGTRTVDVGYQITVQNHRTAPVKLTVHDHIPVAADGDIKVRLREASPAPAEQTDLGELGWTLELRAGPGRPSSGTGSRSSTRPAWNSTVSERCRPHERGATG